MTIHNLAKGRITRLFPLLPSFPKNFCPCCNLLQWTLNIFQAHLHKAMVNFGTIIGILTCLWHNIVTKKKWTNLITYNKFEWNWNLWCSIEDNISWLLLCQYQDGSDCHTSISTAFTLVNPASQQTYYKCLSF
jgi:hypothetical protein